MATKTIVRYRSRPKKRSRGKSATTVPVAVLAGIAPTAAFSIQGFKDGGVEEGAHRLCMRLTGYNMRVGNWYWSEFLRGWAPILGGFVAHKLAGKLGINRALSSAGVPLLRI